MRPISRNYPDHSVGPAGEWRRVRGTVRYLLVGAVLKTKTSWSPSASGARDRVEAGNLADYHGTAFLGNDQVDRLKLC